MSVVAGDRLQVWVGRELAGGVTLVGDRIIDARALAALVPRGGRHVVRVCPMPTRPDLVDLCAERRRQGETFVWKRYAWLPVDLHLLGVSHDNQRALARSDTARLWHVLRAALIKRAVHERDSGVAPKGGWKRPGLTLRQLRAAAKSGEHGFVPRLLVDDELLKLLGEHMKAEKITISFRELRNGRKCRHFAIPAPPKEMP